MRYLLFIFLPFMYFSQDIHIIEYQMKNYFILNQWKLANTIEMLKVLNLAVL